MNLSRSEQLSFTHAGEKSLPCGILVEPPALMVDNEVPLKSTLGAHHQPRQLVRLVQCAHCSKPFSAPVHLPCGHTVCRDCLPAARPRANISYPDTPDRLQGIVCPQCSAEHASAECCVDVTLSKTMELVQLVISKHKPLFENSPTRLVELLAPDQVEHMEEKEDARAIGHVRVLHGGRLLSTFTMAQMGELRYNSEVEYHPQDGHYQYEDLDVALLKDLQEAAQEEMSCQVCYHMMLDPTTTACGHSFCRRCLARVMDNANICPLCRRELHIPASLQNKPSNGSLAALLDMLCPEIINERTAALELEEQAGTDALDTPLFVCTLALPTMPTFLHVFEPRYRLMMRRCMDGNRKFGMVMYNRQGAPQGALGPVHFLEYGTLLYIRNLALLPDGRSFVETVGVGRFKIQDHGMLDGYIVGRIEHVDDVSLSDEQSIEQEETTVAQRIYAAFQRDNPQVPIPFQVALDHLPTAQLLSSCVDFVRAMRAANAHWLNQKIVQVYGEPPENDAALFPYWFACVLPIAEEEKYRLLQTTSVRARLKIVRTWIERIQHQRQ
jgi:Lon protease-like protein